MAFLPSYHGLEEDVEYQGSAPPSLVPDTSTAMTDFSLDYVPIMAHRGIGSWVEAEGDFRAAETIFPLEPETYLSPPEALNFECLKVIPPTNVDDSIGKEAHVPDSNLPSTETHENLTSLLMSAYRQLCQMQHEQSPIEPHETAIISYLSPHKSTFGHPIGVKHIRAFLGRRWRRRCKTSRIRMYGVISQDLPCLYNCGMSWTFKEQRQWEQHHNAREPYRVWVCAVCHAVYVQRYQLKHHYRIHHEAADPLEGGMRYAAEPHRNPLDWGMRYTVEPHRTCGFCGVDFKSSGLFFEHVCQHFKEGADYEFWINYDGRKTMNREVLVTNGGKRASGADLKDLNQVKSHLDATKTLSQGSLATWIEQFHAHMRGSNLPTRFRQLDSGNHPSRIDTEADNNDNKTSKKRAESLKRKGSDADINDRPEKLQGALNIRVATPAQRLTRYSHDHIRNFRNIHGEDRTSPLLEPLLILDIVDEPPGEPFVQPRPRITQEPNSGTPELVHDGSAQMVEPNPMAIGTSSDVEMPNASSWDSDATSSLESLTIDDEDHWSSIFPNCSRDDAFENIMIPVYANLAKLTIVEAVLKASNSFDCRLFSPFKSCASGDGSSNVLLNNGPSRSESRPYSGATGMTDGLVPGDNRNNGKKRKVDTDAAESSMKTPQHVKRFACPFHKHNPVVFGYNEVTGSEYEICGSYRGFRDTKHVKQHLWSKHLCDFRCPRCGKNQGNTRGLFDHARSNPQCIEIDSASMPIDITTDQYEELVRRRRTKRDECAKWYDVYQVLFPNVSRENMPSSPYCADWDVNSFLQAQRIHLRDELPEMTRSRGLPALDDHQMSQLVDMVLIINRRSMFQFQSLLRTSQSQPGDVERHVGPAHRPLSVSGEELNRARRSLDPEIASAASWLALPGAGQEGSTMNAELANRIEQSDTLASQTPQILGLDTSLSDSTEELTPDPSPGDEAEHNDLPVDWPQEEIADDDFLWLADPTFWEH